MICDRTKAAIDAKVRREIEKGNVTYKWGQHNNGGGI
jgi:hypothetical protein